MQVFSIVNSCSDQLGRVEIIRVKWQTFLSKYGRPSRMEIPFRTEVGTPNTVEGRGGEGSRGKKEWNWPTRGGRLDVEGSQGKVRMRKTEAGGS